MAAADSDVCTAVMKPTTGDSHHCRHILAIYIYTNLFYSGLFVVLIL